MATINLTPAQVLKGYSWSNLQEAIKLANEAMLAPERAREVGVYFDRYSAQTVAQLADLVKGLAERLLALRPPEQTPAREPCPRPQSHPPQKRERFGGHHSGPGKVDRLIDLLRERIYTLDELKDRLQTTEHGVHCLIRRGRSRGYDIQRVDNGPHGRGAWQISGEVEP